MPTINELFPIQSQDIFESKNVLGSAAKSISDFLVPKIQEGIKKWMDAAKKTPADIFKEKGYKLGKEESDMLNIAGKLGMSTMGDLQATPGVLNLSQTAENVVKGAEMLKPNPNVTLGTIQEMNQINEGKQLLAQFDRLSKVGDKVGMAEIAEKIIASPPQSPLWPYVNTFRDLYTRLGLDKFGSSANIIQNALKTKEMIGNIPWRQ